MNKIVCNVCGTSYPENAAQCPICGYVQSTDKFGHSDSAEGTYTYVKGGRFSKSNVKKRNQERIPELIDNPESDSAPGAGNGSIVLIAALLVAIILVVAFILLRFFIPNNFIYQGLDGLTLPFLSQQSDETVPEIKEPSTEPTTEATEPTEETTVSLACTAVQINTSNIRLEGIGNTFQLDVTLEPSDTMDPVSYSSSDESVATVSDDGIITAVGSGTATITVTCGAVSAECTVECKVPEEPEVLLELNRKELTLTIEGQSWLLYEGSIDSSEIVWSSDDNKVATIEDGNVVAVGNGDTVVYGTYGEQTVSCIIHCDFEDEGESGSVSEESDEPASNVKYRLYNPHGYASDATLNVGESFILKLVDDKLNQPSGVEWTVKDEEVCTFNKNTVTAKSSGTTKITATYGGKTYTAIVRVR